MASTPKRLNVFERYLTLWVVLCMGAGVALGKLLPGFTDAIRRLEFGEGAEREAQRVAFAADLRLDLAAQSVRHVRSPRT